MSVAEAQHGAHQGEHRAFLNRYYGWSRKFYDLTRKYYLFGRDTALERMLAEPWNSLVEIGPGTGRNLRKLRARRPHAKLGGIDASDAMLEHARAKCPWASLAELEAQLAEDRARGLSWSVANFEPEIGSAAAAVHNHNGRAIAAINVTGHVSGFDASGEQATLIERELKAAAQELSEALGYRGWSAEQI